jgi:hypothetical protein
MDIENEPPPESPRWIDENFGLLDYTTDDGGGSKASLVHFAFDFPKFSRRSFPIFIGRKHDRANRSSLESARRNDMHSAEQMAQRLVPIACSRTGSPGRNQVRPRIA